MGPRNHRLRHLPAWLTVLTLGASASASPTEAGAGLSFHEVLASAGAKTAEGRPTVVLNRLDFPEDVPGAKRLEKHLRRTLKREARRAEWGAGRDNRIEYRFAITRLDLREKDGVLEVTCTAVGRLPKNKVAKSHLTFGGDPKKRSEVIRQVLDIVSRGVITRLAELERRRRGLT